MVDRGPAAEAAAACPPPGMQGVRHVLLTRAEQVYEAVARAARISRFCSLDPSGACRQWVGHLDLPETSLLSYSCSPVQFRIEDAPNVHLVASFQGHRRVRMPSGSVECAENGAMVLPPGTREASGSHSAAILTLDPARLARVAGCLAGSEGAAPPAGWRQASEAPRGSAAGPQALMLQRLLRSLDACAAIDPGLPARMGFSDVLHRIAATLLMPELLWGDPLDLRRLEGRQGQRAFAELLEYIRAHLDHPLPLSDLEARSHYSRRALQYAFRRQLGCTPRQWIREQRLLQARQLLEQADDPRPIHAIARACGYPEASFFSRDVRLRFGLTPSQLRRREL